MQRKTILRKKVVLVANSSCISEEVLRYGLDLCKRIDASLEVLHLLKNEPAQKAAQCFKENMKKLNPYEAVGYIPLLEHRGLSTETVDYAKNRRNILCVVLCLKGEGNPPQKGRRQEKFKEVTRLLDCPVVLYKDTPVN